MSESGGEKVECSTREALGRLEEVVGRLIEDRARLDERVQQADARVRDLEGLLRRFTKGETDPANLQATIARLEAENEALSERMARGRDGVDRLLSRVRFLDERR